MTTTVPQPSDNHAPWCSPAEHYEDPDEPGHGSCYNVPLRLNFGDRGPHEDAVTEASFSLQQHKGATQLTILAGFGMSLDPDQIRPMAMALLAMDSLLKGDLDLTAFYQAEAISGAAEIAGA